MYYTMLKTKQNNFVQFRLLLLSEKDAENNMYK